MYNIHIVKNQITETVNVDLLILAEWLCVRLHDLSQVI